MKEKLSKIYPDLLFADGYDDCIIGLAFRGDLLVTLYDAQAIAIKLMSDGMECEEAYEFIDFNIRGAHVGERTPIFYEGGYDSETETSSGLH